MSCEHRYVPFPGSRSKLYCEYCGTGKDAFARTQGATVRRARASTSAAETARVAPAPPPSLFDMPDPDADDALDVLADRRARRELEQRTREIIGTSNPDLDENEVETLVAQVLEFGPAVDLDNFAQQVAAMTPRDRREQVDESDDTLGRGAGL